MGTFKITPIGGVGQIGSNMTFIEGDKSSFLIDCGILFPSEDVFNINYLIPNFKSMDKVKNIVITHGHEDHIGAIVHLIEHMREITLWASPFTADLIRSKLDFNKISHKINIYREQDTLNFGEFKVDPIHVNHSIPQTFGMMIRKEDEGKCVFFVSDFKIEKDSPYERPFDFKKLEQLSKGYNKKILLADSTNILSKNLRTPGESSLIPSFTNILDKTNNRVFFTTFSSNIYRIVSIAREAIKKGRKIIAYGRSMEQYLAIAKKNNLIDDIHDHFIDPKSISKGQKNLLILVPGCQGDFRGAAKRISKNEDSIFKIGKDDTFVFSSKAIPGNEKKIGQIYNDLTKHGVKIYSSENAYVHVSGHPGKEDLIELYQSFKPTDIVPIHGESFFIEEHIKHINNFNKKIGTYRLLNFDTLNIKDIITVINNEPQDPIIIWGNKSVIEREKISERRKIATNGSIFLSVSRKTSNFEIDYIGLPGLIDSYDEQFQNYLKIFVNSKRKLEDIEFKEALRIETRRFFKEFIGERPIAYVHLV